MSKKVNNLGTRSAQTRPEVGSCGPHGDGPFCYLSIYIRIRRIRVDSYIFQVLAMDGGTAGDTGEFSWLDSGCQEKVSFFPGLILSPNLKIDLYSEGNFARFWIFF